MRRIAAALLLAGCGDKDQPAEGDDGAPAAGGYEDGVYHCCDEGEGDACCDGYEQGMCFQYGGIYGECVGEGQEIEGKVVCGFCCEGLDMREPMVETTDVYADYPAGCGPGPAPPSILVCVACGDGACGAGENPCVCPEDCGDPAGM